MAEVVSEDELRSEIRALVPKVDLETTGVKAFTKLLSKQLDRDLKPYKAFIKEQLTLILNEMQEQDDSEGSDEEEQPVKKKGGGLAAKKEISSALASFFELNAKKKHEMSRTEIVKKLWEHIREHELQNPDNRREIILDDALKSVFGVDQFTMFTMNKYIGAHIHPFTPVDLTTNTTPSRKRKATSKKDKSGTKKRASNQPPYKLSDAMATIVGSDVMNRTQIVKKIWEYIRENDLQNPNDKREIICDDKLKAVMGNTKKVTMFSLNKYISPHLLEKVVKVTQDEDVVEEDEVDGSSDEE